MGREKKQNRARCSKAPIYFCFGDFYVLSFKDSKVLKKKPAARRADFFGGPPSRISWYVLWFWVRREKSFGLGLAISSIFSFFLVFPFAARSSRLGSMDLHGSPRISMDDQ